MRTTVTLDSRIVSSLKHVSRMRTKSKAVLMAVEDYLRRQKVSRIKNLKGKLKFNLTAHEIRHAQR